MAEATTDRADTTEVATRPEAVEVLTLLDPTMAPIPRPSTSLRKVLREALNSTQKAEAEEEEEVEEEEKEVDKDMRRESTEAEAT